MIEFLLVLVVVIGLAGIMVRRGRILKQKFKGKSDEEIKEIVRKSLD